MQPQELLEFIELPQFTKRWHELDLDDESDLSMLQWLIMGGPTKAPVIKGTQGLRKLRFGFAGRGKRGGIRVLYVYFERFGVVLLCLAYSKNEEDDISNAGKRLLNKLIISIGEELKRQFPAMT